MITRHILTIPGTGRRVHYRRCGSGPVVVLVHQSPRSGAEYAPLMRKWASHFTCIAPDSPGFGQSDPLPGTPENEDFADALAEFLRVLGVETCGAYGFHTGAATLIPALVRHPELFSCQVVGGYPVWTEDEIAMLGRDYFPPFQPQPFGEHLVWLWNRFLEQSWVFPWFDIENGMRLPQAHTNVAYVHAVAMDMLDAGDDYRAGYGAAMRGKSAIPSAEANLPPVLISSYDNDPLQSHMDRIGDLPAGWETRKVRKPDDLTDAALAFLRDHTGDAPCPVLQEDANEGWLEIDDGLIHWAGKHGAKRLVLHAPAAEMSAPGPDELAIDVPGHGLSSNFADMEGSVEQAAALLGCDEIIWPVPPSGDPAQLYPDLTPDRFGGHLLKAWSVARADAFFEPWYQPQPTDTPLDPALLAPEAIALRARARLRAGEAAREYHALLESKAAA